MSRKLKISIIAVIVNLFLAIIKITAGLFSNSAAILADGINSCTDVFASIVSYIGIRISIKPADKNHPYGHEKVEYLAGFIITIIIFISGLWIIYDALIRFFDPEDVEVSILAFVIMAISAITNAIMSVIKLRGGKKHDSISLITDGYHSRIDMYVSITVFLGLLLYPLYDQMDSIFGLIVGVFILRESFNLGKETTDALLGISAGKEVEEKITNLINKKEFKIKDLKTQKIGRFVSVELCLLLPKDTKIDQFNNIQDDISADLSHLLPHLKNLSIQLDSMEKYKK